MCRYYRHVLVKVSDRLDRLLLLSSLPQATHRSFFIYTKCNKYQTSKTKYGHQNGNNQLKHILIICSLLSYGQCHGHRLRHKRINPDAQIQDLFLPIGLEPKLNIRRLYTSHWCATERKLSLKHFIDIRQLQEVTRLAPDGCDDWYWGGWGGGNVDGELYVLVDWAGGYCEVRVGFCDCGC